MLNEFRELSLKISCGRPLLGVCPTLSCTPDGEARKCSSMTTLPLFIPRAVRLVICTRARQP